MNNGLVVSFVKFTVSGVDYYTVQYFRKDQSNRFQLAEGGDVRCRKDRKRQQPRCCDRGV
jgi:hypothetical protein